MDVRNANIEVTIEHGGTCLTWFMVPKESFRQATMGSYLEYVSEFELKPGVRLEPHYHDTDEFYYILRGTATIQIRDETRDLSPGDLVHIPRNAAHTIWPTDPTDSFRALAFAVSYMPEGARETATELPPVVRDEA